MPTQARCTWRRWSPTPEPDVRSGFYFRGGEGSESFLAPLLRPLAALGVDPMPRKHTLYGEDLKALARKRGLPTVHLWQDPTHYFDVHHSAADTLDKIDPVALAQSAAATAWLTWSLADAAGTLAPPPIEPPPPAR